jgi:hypothetical protein
MLGTIKLYGSNDLATTITNGLVSISALASLGGLVSFTTKNLNLMPDIEQVNDVQNGAGFTGNNKTVIKDTFKLRGEPLSLQDYNTEINKLRKVMNKQYVYLEIQDWLFDVFGNATNAMPVELIYSGEAELAGSQKIINFDLISMFPRR